jgi:histidine ammonia-lyase
MRRMLAIELLCAAQALDLRGAARAGEGTRAAHALIRRHAAALDEDRALAADVEAVGKLIEEGAF